MNILKNKAKNNYITVRDRLIKLTGLTDFSQITYSDYSNSDEIQFLDHLCSDLYNTMLLAENN